jgi:hypothetical protein
MVFFTFAFSITYCDKGGKNYFRIFDFYPQTPCAFVRAKKCLAPVISTEVPVSSVEDRNGGEVEKSINPFTNRLVRRPSSVFLSRFELCILVIRICLGFRI